MVDPGKTQINSSNEPVQFFFAELKTIEYYKTLI